jgi:dTDP-glucose pyrophosphorylase
VNITYINQGEPRGIAHPVKLTEYFVGDEPFVVYLADNILKGGIQEMVEDLGIPSRCRDRPMPRERPAKLRHRPTEG